MIPITCYLVELPVDAINTVMAVISQLLGPIGLTTLLTPLSQLLGCIRGLAGCP